MYVQVVTIDGQNKTVLNVSKLTKIIQLKSQIEEEFSISSEKQALFFRGKHLENEATLYDYGVNLNNVIQVSQISIVHCSVNLCKQLSCLVNIVGGDQK